MRSVLADAFMRAIGASPEHELIAHRVASRRAGYEDARLDDRSTPDSGQLRAYRLGVHRFQERLYLTRGSIREVLASREVCPVSPTNWELVAYLETLGEVAVASAIQLLPSRLQELAGEWSSAGEDAALQIAVCERLFDALLDDKTGDSAGTRPEEEPRFDDLWLADYLDQDPGRIFPRHFLRDAKGRPNCLGKAILLKAFFDIVRTKVLGATPITSFHDAAERTMVDLGQGIVSCAERKSIQLPERLLKAMRARERLEAARRATPDRFHMAILVPLADGRWFLIDPHQRCCGVLESNNDISYAAELIDLFCPVLPGFAVLHPEGRQFQNAVHAAAMDAGGIVDRAARTVSRWDGCGRNPHAALPLLAQPELLAVFLDANYCHPAERAEELARILREEDDANALFVTLEAAGARQLLNFRTTSGRELSNRERTLLCLAAIVVDFASGGELLPALAVEHGAPCDGGERPDLGRALTNGMNAALGALQAFAYRAATKRLRFGRRSRGLPHPLMEVYEPMFRIGVELVSHLNAVGECDHDVVRELAALCGGQHHAVLAATEPLRTGARTLTPVAAHAVAMLQATPAVLPVVRDGLGHLVYAGLIEAPSELHGDPEDVTKEEEPGERGQPAPGNESAAPAGDGQPGYSLGGPVRSTEGTASAV